MLTVTLGLCVGHSRIKHCTLPSAHYTPHTAHCTLHTAHYTPHTTYGTLNTTHHTLHTAHCTLHTAHCKLHVPSLWTLAHTVHLPSAPLWSLAQPISQSDWLVGSLIIAQSVLTTKVLMNYCHALMKSIKVTHTSIVASNCHITIPVLSAGPNW